jgi:hypothetical protein
VVGWPLRKPAVGVCGGLRGKSGGEVDVLRNGSLAFNLKTVSPKLSDGWRLPRDYSSS